MISHQTIHALLQRKDVFSREDVPALREALHALNHAYYVESAPLVSDSEYDRLFHALKALEITYDLADSSSPTQRIDVLLSQQFQTHEHLSPMISLDNAFSEEDIREFHRRFITASWATKEVEYHLEPKFDWLGLSLRYERGQLVRALTRGNGREGEDVTVNALQIRSIPQSIPLQETLEIRWEIVMPRSEFDRVNRERDESWEKRFANPRNAASGSLRQLNYHVTRWRGLVFYAYHVPRFDQLFWSSVNIDGKPQTLHTYAQYLDLLSRLWFQVPPYRFLGSVESIVTEINQLSEHPLSLGFDIDGLVIKANELELWGRAWTTEHHPRYATAFKFPSEEVTTLLLAVEHSVGRTGAITPVAILDPVQVTGVTVSRATLHNYDEVARLDVCIGDRVWLRRAGEVIPEILAVVEGARPSDAQRIIPPTVCPICSTATIKDGEKVVLLCPNRRGCSAQVLWALEAFVSKHAMDIDGLGPKQLELFLELGWLTDFASIYSLSQHFAALREMEGFGEKSVENLSSAIQASRSVSLERVIVALGIPNVGRKTARMVAELVSRRVGDYEWWIIDYKWNEEWWMKSDEWRVDGDDTVQLWPKNSLLTTHSSHLLSVLFSLDAHSLQSVRDIGPVVAESIVTYLSEYRNEVERLFAHITPVLANVTSQTGTLPLSGKSFCVTGSFADMSRDEIHALIEEQGWEIRTSVTAKLSYLVVGEDAGSKAQKAQTLGVPMISLEDLKKLIAS